MEANDLSLLVPLNALLQTSSVTEAARMVGLSTPAMSHALARIRERLQDPILVRAGRQMVLTPRGEALRPKVQALLAGAREVLTPARPFSAKELTRTFSIRATDHILSLLGVSLDRIVKEEAPKVTLRFTPNSPDDPAHLRSGEIDLAIGTYKDLPPELRSRALFTDRFVCVMRTGHPLAKKKLTLEEYLRVEHVQVAPRGRPGGSLDDALRELGVTRRVARAVPYFTVGLLLVSETDYIITISEKLAQRMAPTLGLVLREPPLSLKPYTLSLLWHPRMDGDPGHRWLREAFGERKKLIQTVNQSRIR